MTRGDNTCTDLVVTFKLDCVFYSRVDMDDMICTNKGDGRGKSAALTVWYDKV